MANISKTSRPRKASMPYQKNKIPFPVIRKARIRDKPTSEPQKTRKVKEQEQTNTLPLPILPPASFPSGRDWMLSRARPYIIAKQTGDEEEVEDFLSRLYVAYRLDFPLVRGLDETLEQYEARQDKEIQDTVLPMLEYSVTKFCIIASKTPWTIPAIENVEVKPISSIRPRPRPAWNVKKVVPAETAPVLPVLASTPGNESLSPSPSPSLSPYQFASPAPTLSPFSSIGVSSPTQELGSPFELSPPSPLCLSPRDDDEVDEFSPLPLPSLSPFSLSPRDDDEVEFRDEAHFDEYCGHVIDDWCRPFVDESSASDSEDVDMEEAEVSQILGAGKEDTADGAMDDVKVENVEVEIKVEQVEENKTNWDEMDGDTSIREWIDSHRRAAAELRAEIARQRRNPVQMEDTAKDEWEYASPWGPEF